MLCLHTACACNTTPPTLGAAGRLQTSELLLKCQAMACPAGWNSVPSTEAAAGPSGLWHSSPAGKAEEQPCKLSLILHLSQVPRLHCQGLQVAQRGTAFRTGWPQPNHPTKAVSSDVNSQGTRTWQEGQSHTKGNTAELVSRLHPLF